MRAATKPFVSTAVWTFDPRKLTRASFIDVPAHGRLRIVLPGGHGVPGSIFHQAHPNYLLKDSHLAGFLYYHLPYPAHFLSGHIRFRCTHDSSPHAFLHGHDLPNRAGLPWGFDLPRLFAREKQFAAWRRQLVFDGLVSEVQIDVAQRLLSQNHLRLNVLQRPAFVHDITQPFVVDLTVGMRVLVLGPNSVISVDLYPSVAYTGAAVVCFEPTGNGDEALRARVLTPLPNYHIFHSLHPNWSLDPILTRYLQEFRHLPPLRAGDLLPHPFQPGLPWVWRYDDKQPARSAALHCLFHPPKHFPSRHPSPADDVLAGRILIKPREKGLLLSDLMQRAASTPPFSSTTTDLSSFSPLEAAERMAGAEQLPSTPPSTPPSTLSSRASVGSSTPAMLSTTLTTASSTETPTPAEARMAEAVAEALRFSLKRGFDSRQSRDAYLARNQFILGKDEGANDKLKKFVKVEEKKVVVGDVGERTGSQSESADGAATTTTGSSKELTSTSGSIDDPTPPAASSTSTSVAPTPSPPAVQEPAFPSWRPPRDEVGWGFEPDAPRGLSERERTPLEVEREKERKKRALDGRAMRDWGEKRDYQGGPRNQDRAKPNPSQQGGGGAQRIKWKKPGASGIDPARSGPGQRERGGNGHGNGLRWGAEERRERERDGARSSKPGQRERDGHGGAPRKQPDGDRRESWNPGQRAREGTGGAPPRRQSDRNGGHGNGSKWDSIRRKSDDEWMKRMASVEDRMRRADRVQNDQSGTWGLRG
ncbi:hypothetical protein C8F04DRAFT_1244269 [Mycena alexandri]|uniref:Uncharacterized protein n=1 Tax=Mycena alexandri TaxID=1745969 RepID=A0AAD6WLW2_9AGAR|nr:hypothetical protein C8F04DRAFT_1244269 [Mycena alexandri]